MKGYAAWAVVDFRGIPTSVTFYTREAALAEMNNPAWAPEDGEHVVRLVPHEPAADAVVRAVRKTNKLYKICCATGTDKDQNRWRDAAKAQDRAVERLERSRRKGKKR